MSFAISAPPSTDIWRKPPSTNRFNAPTQSLLSSGSVPLKSFNRVRLSFNANWTTRYDQGGILLHLTKAEGNLASESDRWIKTGIEFYMGKPYISTVATLTFSDWSIYPTTTSSASTVTNDKTTIELRREKDELGSSLWVNEIVLDVDGNEVERKPLREITWFFAEEDGWFVDVRAMAARPADEGSVIGKEKNLLVQFEGAQVDVDV
ncbi:hypothetical protein K435DRAFT_970254 [Dendrothele bispora CBS 962.96]|uniref:Uncharacterized protein n=1 Tax=Dendrothele bispora (strain CBS 962.96) TaxID=1314807 RepID=A0A4V4HDA6_DENBC|nr:hypothetical protein K435DRAFT_970254 [Dendrothele bispora CBS 962.96]